jgi:hypothetical protein
LRLFGDDGLAETSPEGGQEQQQREEDIEQRTLNLELRV